MAKRSTKEAYEIVKYTYNLIAKGKGYTEIRGILHKKYNIAFRSADRYFTMALKIIRKEFSKDMIDIKNTSLLNYNKMLNEIDKKTMQAKDLYRLKLDIKKQMDKINGLEVTNINHSGQIKTLGELKIIGVDVDNTNTEKDTSSNTTA